jgi:hypothetical protein
MEVMGAAFALRVARRPADIGLAFTRVWPGEPRNACTPRARPLTHGAPRALPKVPRMPKGNGKHGSQIKDDEQYEALRREGMSKEKAARIANASARTSRSATGRKGGESPKYEDWSKEDLYEKAKEVGIEGRSDMDKDELITALRDH